MADIVGNIQSLITASNEKTGRADSTMTAATQTLIAGYGAGKPEQTYVRTYTKNDEYPIVPDTGKVISGGKITVAVTPNIQPKTFTQNGTFSAPAGVDGFSPVTVNVPSSDGENVEITVSKSWLVSIPIFELRYVRYDLDGSLLFDYKIIRDSSEIITVAKNSIFLIIADDIDTSSISGFNLSGNCIDKKYAIQVLKKETPYNVGYCAQAISSGTLAIMD